MVDKDSAPPQLIRYSQFEKDPEAVIDNCNATGTAAVITNHGRLAFIIEPLDVQHPGSDSEISQD